jgi:hypothetical protein
LARTQIACDAVEMESALEAGDLEEASDLYRGDLLPGFFLSECPAFGSTVGLIRGEDRWEEVPLPTIQPFLEPIPGGRPRLGISVWVGG